MTHTAAPALEAGAQQTLPVAPAWAKRKGWNSVMAQAMGRSLASAWAAADYSRCAERIGMKLAYVEGDALAMPVTSAHFCGHRLCPVCSWRKASAWRRRLIPGLEAFHADHPTHVAVLLTLTVRNCRVEELGATLKDIHGGWDRLVKTRSFPTKFWLRRTEVTVGHAPLGPDAPAGPGSRSWGKADDRAVTEELQDHSTECARDGSTPALWVHPHVHSLLLVPASYFSHGYIRQSRWQQEWQMAARLDYAPRVDVRRAYAKGRAADPARATIAAALEAAKYVGKPADFVKHAQAVVPVEEQIRGVRMIGVSRPLSQYVRTGNITEQEMLDPMNKESMDRWSSEVFASWDSSSAAYFFET